MDHEGGGDAVSKKCQSKECKASEWKISTCARCKFYREFPIDPVQRELEV